MTYSKKPTAETLENWHNDPNNWKWGWAYYNKADKRILPPKLNKNMGWTINFANPFSIVSLLALVAIIILIIRFIISL